MRERKGLTLRELSERSGIPAGTLAWWSSRLRREESGFAEVVVADRETDGAVGRGVVIRLRSGREIEAPEDIDSDVLKGIVEALESC